MKRIVFNSCSATRKLGVTLRIKNKEFSKWLKVKAGGAKDYDDDYDEDFDEDDDDDDDEEDSELNIGGKNGLI